jgi:hypothetical protein
LAIGNADQKRCGTKRSPFNQKQPAIGNDHRWHSGIKGCYYRHFWGNRNGWKQRITIITKRVSDMR